VEAAWTEAYTILATVMKDAAAAWSRRCRRSRREPATFHGSSSCTRSTGCSEIL